MSQLVRKGSGKLACPTPEALGIVLPADQPFLRTQLVTIVAMLHGLARNVLNGDMMVLALYDAQDIAVGMGCDKDQVKGVINAYLDFYKTARRTNPMAAFFPEP